MSEPRVHSPLWLRGILFLFLCIASLLTILPFIWMISTSFKKPDAIFVLPPQWIPKQPVLENFRILFEEVNFFRHFVNSVVLATASTLVSLFVNSMAGYAFAKYQFRGREKVFNLLLATMMVPAQVTMIPVFLLLKKIGLLDTYWGIIIPGSASVFAIFLMRQFMVAIPNDYIEAARIDGCNEWQIYLKLILPLSKPVLATLTIFTFMGSWNDFLWPLIVMFREKMYTLPVALANLSGGAHEADYGILMAGAMVVVIPIVIVFLLMQRQYIRGISMTGLKG